MFDGFFRRHEPEPEVSDVLKGVAAGMVGGIVGSWVMNYVHTASAAARRLMPQRPAPRKALVGIGPPPETGRMNVESGIARDKEEREGSDPATVKTAEIISRRVFQHDLRRREKAWAGPAVHFGYGTLMAGAYGGLAEAMPKAATGWGLPFAASLWLVGDELMVPALGLGKPPHRAPISKQAEGLAAHLVYGVTVEGVRRLVRRVLG